MLPNPLPRAPEPFSSANLEVRSSMLAASSKSLDIVLMKASAFGMACLIPSVIPAGIHLPIRSANRLEGDPIPKAEATPSTRPLARLLSQLVNPSQALLIPRLIPLTISEPIDSICPGISLTLFTIPLKKFCPA